MSLTLATPTNHQTGSIVATSEPIRATKHCIHRSSTVVVLCCRLSERASRKLGLGIPSVNGTCVPNTSCFQRSNNAPMLQPGQTLSTARNCALSVFLWQLLSGAVNCTGGPPAPCSRNAAH